MVCYFLALISLSSSISARLSLSSCCSELILPWALIRLTCNSSFWWTVSLRVELVFEMSPLKELFSRMRFFFYYWSCSIQLACWFFSTLVSFSTVSSSAFLLLSCNSVSLSRLTRLVRVFWVLRSWARSDSMSMLPLLSFELRSWLSYCSLFISLRWVSLSELVCLSSSSLSAPCWFSDSAVWCSLALVVFSSCRRPSLSVSSCWMVFCRFCRSWLVCCVSSWWSLICYLSLFSVSLSLSLRKSLSA